MSRIRDRRGTPGVRVLLASAVLAGALHAGAAAETVTLTLPVVTVAPGGTVSVPIVMSRGLDGLGVRSIQFTLPFTPGWVSGAEPSGSGVVDAWGPPFWNSGVSAYALAAAGAAPVTSTSTLLQSVLVTVSPSAPASADMPLTLTNVLFNEGDPAVVVVDGLLQIRSTAAVEGAGAVRLALAPARPNPARGAVRLAFTLPASDAGGARTRLTVHGLDGRRVRTLADGAWSAGVHELRWDARDEAGHRAPPGVYLVRLEHGAAVVTERLALLW